MDNLYPDILIYICIHLDKRSTLLFLATCKIFYTLRNDDSFFKGMLLSKLIDMKLIYYNRPVNYANLWRVLPSECLSKYSGISLNKMYTLYNRSLELGSPDLLIFSISKGIIPQHKYSRGLDQLIRNFDIDLFNILIQNIEKKDYWYIKMIIEHLKYNLKFQVKYTVHDEKCDLIKYLIKFDKLYLIEDLDISYISRDDYLNEINDLKLFRYYVTRLKGSFGSLRNLKNSNKILIWYQERLEEIVSDKIISHLISSSEISDGDLIALFEKRKITEVSVQILKRIYAYGRLKLLRYILSFGNIPMDVTNKLELVYSKFKLNKSLN